MTISNLKNNKTASGSSKSGFSSARLLIADPVKAEQFAHELLTRICSSTELKTRALTVICHPLDPELSDLSPAEKMIFQDFIHQIGGNRVKWMSEKRELTPEEVKMKIGT